MKKLKTIAVLIPCYNEGQTIRKVVTDFRAALPGADIYVYDNNSTDNTVQEATEAGAIVRHEYQQGKGNVIRRMFREIDADAYVMVDGDDTYPAKHASEMVRTLFDKQADMVVGDRLSSTYFTENKRPFHNFGNTIVRGLINMLFHGNIRDVMTGYRVMSRQFVKTFPVLSKGFEIETEMTIHTLHYNMAIENVIIDYQDRPEGSVSKLNTYSDGFKVLMTILKACKFYRPTVFFSVFSLIFFVLGVLGILTSQMNLGMLGIVMDMPRHMLSLCSLSLGFMTLFVGAILQTIANQQKHTFEFRLQEVNQWEK